MLGRLALVTLLAVVTLTTPAGARLRALGPGSPVLFGDRVLWSDGSRVHAAPVAGGQASVFGDLGARDGEVATLASGPGLVAAELRAGGEGRLVAAGADGLFRPLATDVGDRPLSLAMPPLSVTAAGVLAGGYLYGGGRRKIVLPPGAEPDGVAAAGELGVVPTPDGGLVVFDLRTGTEQRQIPLGGFDATSVNGLAISAQGDVAATLPVGDGDDVLLWAPASASRAWVIARGDNFLAVAVARGRVAYVSGHGMRDGERVVVVDPGPRREIFRGPRVARVAALSFDGAWVAFGAADCSYVAPAGPAGARATLPPGPCTRSDAAVSSEAPLVRGNRYRVRVACINAPERRCSVRARLRTRSGAEAGRVSTRLPSRAARVVEVPLTARGRRARASSLRLTVTLVDPDGRARVVYDL